MTFQLTQFNSTTTIIRTTGTLTTGPVTFDKNANHGLPAINTTANTFNFIGNPYASPVNWNLLNLQDVHYSYTIWDPVINYRGAYVTYNLGEINNGSSKMNKEIQSGQGFFVQTGEPGLNTNPQVTFTETAKSDSNTYLFRPIGYDTKFKLQLITNSYLGESNIVDGLAIVYDSSFSKDLGNEDSYKIPNPDENIAIIRNGIALNIEGRPFIYQFDTIALKIWNYRQKTYALQIETQNIDPSLEAVIKDAYLGTETSVSLLDTSRLFFSIDQNPASYAADRFMILFRPASTLPVTITDLTGIERDKGVQLSWTAHTESGIAKYVVERSVNGRDFMPIGTLEALNLGVPVQKYSWFDAKVQPGDNFYRIIIYEKSGALKYTNVVKVRVANVEGTFSIYPNPVKNSTIKVHLDNMPPGKYAYNMYNDLGEKVATGSIEHNGGSAVYSVKVRSSVSKGSYRFTLATEENIMNATLIFE